MINHRRSETIRYRVGIMPYYYSSLDSTRNPGLKEQGRILRFCSSLCGDHVNLRIRHIHNSLYIEKKYVNNFVITMSRHTDREIEDSVNLMKESFGEVDVATKRYYEWLYIRNPAGLGTVFIACDKGTPVGQFACIPCIYKFYGNKIIVPLTLNLCVHPKYRGMGLMNQLVVKMHEYLSHNNYFSIGMPNSSSLARTFEEWVYRITIDNIGKAYKTVFLF